MAVLMQNLVDTSGFYYSISEGKEIYDALSELPQYVFVRPRPPTACGPRFPVRPLTAHPCLSNVAC